MMARQYFILPSLGVVFSTNLKKAVAGQFRRLRRLLDCLYCIARALAANYVVRPVPNAAYWLRAAVSALWFLVWRRDSSGYQSGKRRGRCFRPKKTALSPRDTALKWSASRCRGRFLLQQSTLPLLAIVNIAVCSS